MDFEILCVTMNQKDFSKIVEMNIHSNVIFANQANHTEFKRFEFDGNEARMIITDTHGVGINRNLALMYAKGDVCLFADDDVTYVNNMENLVVNEFKAHPDADIIVFNLDTDSENRKQIRYDNTKKCPPWQNLPWGCFRIAFRLNSIRRANIWYTTLFGGGCKFPSGEDSMWLTEAKRKGLCFYVSNKVIGKVSFDTSSWFTGFDNKFYYAKGAFCQATHPNSASLRLLYFLWRLNNFPSLTNKEKWIWMNNGRKGYQRMLSYDEFITNINKKV